jgi:hypothetical protein
LAEDMKTAPNAAAGSSSTATPIRCMLLRAHARVC